MHSTLRQMDGYVPIILKQYFAHMTQGHCKWRNTCFLEDQT